MGYDWEERRLNVSDAAQHGEVTELWVVLDIVAVHDPDASPEQVGWCPVFESEAEARAAFPQADAIRVQAMTTEDT